MTRRVTRALAVGALAAVPLATAAPAEALTCPPGTYSRYTGVDNPVTGEGIYYCHIWTP